MALGGMFQGDTSKEAYLQVWWNATQNVPQNSSTITMSVYLRYRVINIPDGNACGVTIAGVSQSGFFGAIISDTDTLKLKLLGTFTQTVQHNPNGTLSATLEARASHRTAPIADVETSVTLDRIYQRTGIDAASDITADAATVNIHILWNVHNKDYTHELKVMNGSTALLTLSGITAPANGVNVMNVTLTAQQRTTLLAGMANVKSLPVTLQLTSFSGGTAIGVSTYAVTLITTAENSAPLFTGFTFSDYLAATVNVTGNIQTLIQGYSKLRIICTAATPRNGATIKTYSAVCGNKSKSGTGTTIELDEITTAGELTLAVTVTDSRGYTATITQMITVIPYTKPNIQTVDIRRYNSVEDTIQFSFEGQISSLLVAGVNKNSVTYIRYRYKRTSETQYSSFVSLLSASTIMGNNFSYSSLEAMTLSADNSWNVSLEVRDALGSLSLYTLDLIVPQGTPLIALRPKKVGINNPDPQRTLDVGGIIGMNGQNVMGFVRRLSVSGENFNDIIQSGYYLYYADVHYAQCTNVPGSVHQGYLEVFAGNHGYYMQRYTNGSNQVYVRTRGIGGTWTSWIEK